VQAPQLLGRHVEVDNAIDLAHESLDIGIRRAADYLDPCPVDATNLLRQFEVHSPEIIGLGPSAHDCDLEVCEFPVLEPTNDVPRDQLAVEIAAVLVELIRAYEVQHELSLERP